MPDWVKQVTNNLFAIMEVRYEGTYHRTWSSAEEVKEAKRNWAKDIRALDQQLVKNGIELLFDRYPEWPPNLNGFINLCKEKRPNQDMYKTIQLRLPKKPTEAEIKIGKEILEKLRSITRP